MRADITPRGVSVKGSVLEKAGAFRGLTQAGPWSADFLLGRDLG
jgi:hypothetical protein